MYDYLRVYIVDNLVIYRRLWIDLIQSALVTTQIRVTLEFSIGPSEDCQNLFCNGFDAVPMRRAPRSSGLLRVSRSQVYLMLSIDEHKI